MAEPKIPERDPQNVQISLVKTSTLVYGVMAVIGLFIIHYVHHSLEDFFALPSGELMGRDLALAGLGAGVLLILSYFFEEYVPSFQSLKWAFAEVLGRCSLLGAVYLAAASAIGEEILFRGAIQPGLGLIFTSILFGVLHIGPSGGLSSWSVWATLAGLLIGWIFQSTQSLWPVILCHFAVNLFSMTRLRSTYREYLRYKEQQATEALEKP